MIAVYSDSAFKQLLLENGLLEIEQLADLHELDDEKLRQHLLQARLVDETDLAKLLAEHFHVPFVDLQGFVVDKNLFEVLPVARALELNVLPYGHNDNVLQVACAGNITLNLEVQLAAITGCQIKLLMSTKSAIHAAINRSEGGAALVRSITHELNKGSAPGSTDQADVSISIEDTHETAAPAVRLLNSIIRAALQRKASDIHIESSESGMVLRYRVDGLLYQAGESVDRQYRSSLVSRIKILSNLDIAEKRLPQDGRFKVISHESQVDCRVSVLPSLHGEDVVIRLLDQSMHGHSGAGLSLDQLGMPEKTAKQFRKAIHEPYGLVLLTGPTGSGKTTTLYSALTEIYTGHEKIITVEDPVEYQLPGVTQIAVDEKKGLTFAKGLRSILRHDPDVMMIGEIRDLETAEIAVQSALTGHLVLSTVHANSVFDVIGRFTHIGVDVYNLVSSLNCVVAQRLLRCLCVHCKSEVFYSEQELVDFGVAGGVAAKARWFEAVGCPECHDTGYLGRFAISELLFLTDELKQMFISRKPMLEVKEVALKNGLRSLRQCAISKAVAGETSLSEANRVTFTE